MTARVAAIALGLTWSGVLFTGASHATTPEDRLHPEWRILPARGSVQPVAAEGVQRLAPRPAQAIYVATGTFLMGATDDELRHALLLCKREPLGPRCDEVRETFLSEAHPHKVSVSSFLLDRTEVTVGAYRRCVAASACAAPGFVGGDARFDRPDLPVTHVRFDDATQYCQHVNGRLPTEAEWEFAARGTERREFPWGNIYNPRLANHGSFAREDTDSTDGYAVLAPTGAIADGATPAGIVDLAGNVAEYVSDFYSVDENGYGYSEDAALNPTGPKTGAHHVIRGGSYLDGAPWVRASSRRRAVTPRSTAVGFRCAYDAHAR